MWDGMKSNKQAVDKSNGRFICLDQTSKTICVSLCLLVVLNDLKCVTTQEKWIVILILFFLLPHLNPFNSKSHPL